MNQAKKQVTGNTESFFRLSTPFHTNAYHFKQELHVSALRRLREKMTHLHRTKSLNRKRSNQSLISNVYFLSF